MALLAPPLDYTDKDFDSIEARLNNLISSVFPNWTDRNVANFGNLLVDMHAFILDVLTKYQDAQARECRWSQATQLKNILAAVQMIGYEPSGITAAQAQISITIAPSSTGVSLADVTLPAGDTVSTLDAASPITYQLLEALTIPAGQTTATATVENSETQTDTFSSNGQPNQSFALSQTPYIDASAEVVATDGTYTQVANFLSATPTSTEFTLAVDSTSRATLFFGNGVNGAIPQGTITVTYKTGGGSAGRVDQNQLQKWNDTSITDAVGNAVTVTVNNPLPSSGGLDAQSVGQIQQLAPLSVRVSDRTIAKEDYEIVALTTPGVARALMTTSNEDPGVQENHGILYVVPPGAGAVSTSLVEAIQAGFVARPYPTCMRLAIQGPFYVVVNVSAVVFRAKGVTQAAARLAIVLSLVSYLADTIATGSVFRADGSRWNVNNGPNPDAGKSNPLVDFGFNYQDQDGNPLGLLPFSGLSDAIGTTPGIVKVGAGPADVLLNGLRADVALPRNGFPKLGNVTLIDGSLGVTF